MITRTTPLRVLHSGQRRSLKTLQVISQQQNIIGRKRSLISSNITTLVDLLAWQYSALHKQNFNSRAQFKQAVSRIHTHIAKSLSPTYEKQVVNPLQTIFNAAEVNPFESSRHSPGKKDKQTSTTWNDSNSRVLNGLEHDCIAQVAAMLSKARFHLISGDEINYASKSEYRFTLPYKVNWNSFAKKPIHGIQSELYALDTNHSHPPANHGGVLVFHRGIGIDMSEGRYISEKLDQLVKRSVVHAVHRLWVAVTGVMDAMNAWVNRHASLVLRSMRFSYELVVPSATRDALKEIRTLAGSRTYALMFGQPKVVVQPGKDDAKQQSPLLEQPVEKRYRDVLFERALLARRSLADVDLSARAFFSGIRLQEPTFKQVVVMYRLEDPAPPNTDFLSQSMWKVKHLGELQNRGPSCEARLGKYQQDLQNLEIPDPNRRNIHVMMYRDIPMSDIELLFPNKRVYMRPFDRVTFMMSASMALVSAVPLLSQNATVSKAYLAAFVAAASYQLRLLSRTYSTWMYYTTLTNSLVAEKLVANGAAAAEWIKHEAVLQSVKEASVVYLAVAELQAQGVCENGCTVEAVNAQCLNILKKTCGGHHIFFQALPSLKHLVEEGLVVETYSHEANRNLYSLARGG